MLRDEASLDIGKRERGCSTVNPDSAFGCPADPSFLSMTKVESAELSVTNGPNTSFAMFAMHFRSPSSRGTRDLPDIGVTEQGSRPAATDRGGCDVREIPRSSG
jgi:hypothetical protein